MSSADDTQVVTFGLGDEVFAVPVMIVREILDHVPPFRIPNGPAWLLGLTDVREQGVPTVDLRSRLGLESVSTTSATRILIIDLPLVDRLLTLGIVVDRVMSVIAITQDRIEPSPDIGTRWRSDYIKGVVRQSEDFSEGFLVLVDVARLFADDHTALLPSPVDEAA